ncbi:MAG: amidohydrolase family protein [Burkholderiales bacterium]
MTTAHRIDVHHHPSPPSYIAGRSARDRAYPPQLNWTLAKSLEDMDRGGVATSMLSLPHSVQIWPGDKKEGRDLAREWNEYMAKMASDHPGKFGVFAALPILDIESSLIELEYALDILKADGICLMTSIGDKWLGDIHYAPVFEEMNRRGTIVYTHPVAPDCCRGILAEFNDSVIEYGTDTTRAIGKLLFSGSAVRYPRIQFIFSHGGGTMPFLAGRFLQNIAGHPVPDKLPRGVMPEIERFYYDVAQSAYPANMAALRAVVPMSQVLFGTDFPYGSAEKHANRLSVCGLCSADVRAIECDNARRLFPRFAATNNVS